MCDILYYITFIIMSTFTEVYLIIITSLATINFIYSLCVKCRTYIVNKRFNERMEAQKQLIREQLIDHI